MGQRGMVVVMLAMVLRLGNAGERATTLIVKGQVSVCLLFPFTIWYLFYLIMLYNMD